MGRVPSEPTLAAPNWFPRRNARMAAERPSPSEAAFPPLRSCAFASDRAYLLTWASGSGGAGDIFGGRTIDALGVSKSGSWHDRRSINRYLQEISGIILIMAGYPPNGAARHVTRTNGRWPNPAARWIRGPSYRIRRRSFAIGRVETASGSPWQEIGSASDGSVAIAAAISATPTATSQAVGPQTRARLRFLSARRPSHASTVRSCHALPFRPGSTGLRPAGFFRVFGVGAAVSGGDGSALTAFAAASSPLGIAT